MHKTEKIIMLCICSLMLLVPIFFVNHNKGEVSEGENRYLAGIPKLFLEDGRINETYSTEFETWINDNIGFRDLLIDSDAFIQYHLFRRITRGAMYLGVHDDLIFATDDMLRHYQQLDLKSDEELSYIASNYQLAADAAREQGSQFYYVQCYDKHSIYPEQFMKYVNQFGDVSRTDQIISALEQKTDIDVISLKEIMLNSKKDYEVYSNWGDPTHWSFRGAYVGYLEIMRRLNQNNHSEFKTLKESDYEIEIGDGGRILSGGVHKEDMLEVFTIKCPKAELIELQGWIPESAMRGSNLPLHYINNSVNNNTKLLIIGDSYLRDFIMDDLAESFAEITFISAGLENVLQMDAMIEAYQPDIILFECGERADASYVVSQYAEMKREQ